MNILYELDSNFAPQVCASMASLCDSNRDVEDIHFYIFGLALNSTAAENLRRVAREFGRSIDIIAIDGFMEAFGNFDTFGWSEIILSRLLMARFLPEGVNRVLHLDGDTIVLSSLKDYWNTEFEGDQVIAGCIEATVDRDRLEALGLARSQYFNAGVLLVDLKRWREEGIERKIVDYCLENGDKLFANDQDAINIVLKGRIKAVSPAYNWCNSYVFYNYRTLNSLMRGVPYYSKDEYKRGTSKPAIIHYLGEERPWREGNKHRYRDEYLRYLGATPYKGVGMEQGWRGYFVAWNVFNALMHPFPMARYRIITRLIPVVMEKRKRARKKDAEN